MFEVIVVLLNKSWVVLAKRDASRVVSRGVSEYSVFAAAARAFRRVDPPSQPGHTNRGADLTFSPRVRAGTPRRGRFFFRESNPYRARLADHARPSIL